MIYTFCKWSYLEECLVQGQDVIGSRYERHVPSLESKSTTITHTLLFKKGRKYI